MRLSWGKEAWVKVVTRNRSSSPLASAALTITAEQNGMQVFGTTTPLQQTGGKSRVVVRDAFTPSQPGEITWTATIQDDDPDTDQDTDTTKVRP